MLFYPINLGIFTFSAIYSPTDIVKEHPRIVLFCFGFLYYQVTLRYQFSGISHEEVCAFRRTNLTCWAMLVLNYGHHYLTGSLLYPEYTMFLVILTIAVVSTCHLIIFACRELKDILGVQIFTIKTKQS